MRKTNGFTLFEILIALFIFAIVGTMAAMGLRSVAHSFQHIKKTSQQLSSLEVGVALMRNDLSQLIDRAVLQRGLLLPPLLSTGANGFVFTRTGAHLSRVGYVLQHHQIQRLLWKSLDAETVSPPEKEVLFTQVQSWHVQFVLDASQKVTQWPLSNGANIQVQNSRSVFPWAIQVEIQFSHHARLTLFFPLVARGGAVESV